MQGIINWMAIVLLMHNNVTYHIYQKLKKYLQKNRLLHLLKMGNDNFIFSFHDRLDAIINFSLIIQKKGVLAKLFVCIFVNTRVVHHLIEHPTYITTSVTLPTRPDAIFSTL